MCLNTHNIEQSQRFSKLDDDTADYEKLTIHKIRNVLTYQTQKPFYHSTWRPSISRWIDFETQELASKFIQHRTVFCVEAK